MNILAIDTALEACSVAIANGSGAAIIRSEIIGRGHAERLFGMVAEALQDAGLALTDIDRFGVTTGPGSFTGIRVGIAAMRGFALVTKADAIGYSTLAVHAWSARRIIGRTRVLSLLPAKGDAFFAQLFDDNGDEATEPMVQSADQIAEFVAQSGAALAGAGSDRIEAGGAMIAHTNTAPDVEDLLEMARSGEQRSTPLRPLYIKPPDAAPAKPAIARR